MAANVELPAQLPKDGDPYPEPTDEQNDIVNVLTGYYNEADSNRKGGLNPRDAKWSQNLDLYWNRYNWSGKADWQAKEVMPEVPGFVDRFAASLKDALVSEDFYSVNDPYDMEDDLSWAIKAMTDVWLTTAGRNQLGQPLSFPTVFEEQMKMGALMACSATVLWRNDIKGGRVAVESIDPRNVWLDHTYRSLYRIRRVELDMADLIEMKGTKDSGGEPIFDVLAVEAALAGQKADNLSEKQALTGTGHEMSSTRKPIVMDEYLATVVTKDGRMLAKDELMVVVNGKYLVRGPEKNPYDHGRDWLVYCPLITTPLSVYGRTYMEDFGDVARVYTELTNLILDAVQTSAIKAFALVPGMLMDPTQAMSGVWPNKTFLLQEGMDARMFAQELSLGHMTPEVLQMWTSLKNELHEAAGINEVGMGQFAPNSRTSATEVGATLNNSGAIVKSIAQTVETRFLNPILDLTWKTGLQMVKSDDPRMMAAINDRGGDMWGALMENRDELISRPVTFQAQGISRMIQKSRTLQALMQLMQILAGSQDLLAAFMQKVDTEKLLNLLFNLSSIDPHKLQKSERDRMIESIAKPLNQGAEGGTATPPGLAGMGDAASALGIAKQGAGAGP